MSSVNSPVQQTHENMRRKFANPVDKRDVISRGKFNQHLPINPPRVPGNRGFDKHNQVKEANDKVRYNKAYSLHEDKKYTPK